MSELSRRRRSVRQAGHRRRSLYADPDTDDSFEVSDDGEDFEAIAPPRTKRRRLNENASPRQADSPTASQDGTPAPRTQRRTTRVRPMTIGESTVGRVTSLMNQRLQRRRPGTTSKRGKSSPNKQNMVRQEGTALEYTVPSDHVRPAWSTLPYEVLLQVFSFAYGPEKGSHNWLLRSACRTCRAFAEPALSAFYSAPRLPTSVHLESLLKLVNAPQERRYMNYAVKVKHLEIDIDAFVNHKDATDQFEFGELVSRLPRLQAIIIASVQDKPPYRRHAAPRWKYSESWLDAVLNSGVRLKSWRWNWLFVRQGIGALRLYDYMLHSHTTPAFAGIRHLEIGDHPEFVTDEDTLSHQEDKIAEMIAALPALTSLELETCDIVNARFLQHLPASLTCLRLANCEALDSDAIEAYLSQDSGCQLEELVLDHNVRLDLGFLPLLSSTCHRLKRLSMDLHCYSQHHTVNDAEPRYKTALDDDKMPTWPATLESLELLHVQKLTATAGKNLFASLLDSAAGLPCLRSIVIQAHISISWRDRVSFRTTWIDQLRRVFLRRARKPDPSLASFKAFRLAKSLEAPIDFHGDKSGRTMISVAVPASPGDLASYSEHSADETMNNTRRSRRIALSEAEQQARKTRAAEASEAAAAFAMSADDDDDDDEDEHGRHTSVQGLCHTVDIRIDNLRPREEQLNESHFLDSEESGDEDWSEGAEVVEETYAW